MSQTLALHSHPLASFCQKVLVALYENGTPFDHVMVDHGDPESRARLFALWPVGKIPVLHDIAAGRILPETSIIIEYLDAQFPGARPMLPAGEAERLEARLWDRIFDCHVQEPMQRIVAERMRPGGEKDPRGAREARALLLKAYALIDARMAGRVWAVGDRFSLADCAAAPALFYAGAVCPFAADFPHLAAYFDRLLERPSFARVLDEARPFLRYFPFADDIPPRFLDRKAG